MESKLYNQEGKEVGTITVPEAVFGVKGNHELLHQVATAFRSNARQSSAHTKDRSKVSGGGKKPWQQKGTGRARHGSIRSPLWRGGGITFGPTNEKNYEKKTTRKMRAKALAIVLSEKLRREQLFFVDMLTVPGAKTKHAKGILSNLSGIMRAGDSMKKKKNALFISVPTYDETTHRAFRNMGNVEISPVKDLSALQALAYKYLVITRPELSLPILEKRIKK